MEKNTKEPQLTEQEKEMQRIEQTIKRVWDSRSFQKLLPIIDRYIDADKRNTKELNIDAAIAASSIALGILLSRIQYDFGPFPHILFVNAIAALFTFTGKYKDFNVGSLSGKRLEIRLKLDELSVRYNSDLISDKEFIKLVINSIENYRKINEITQHYSAMLTSDKNAHSDSSDENSRDQRQ